MLFDEVLGANECVTAEEDSDRDEVVAATIEDS